MQAGLFHELTLKSLYMFLKPTDRVWKTIPPCTNKEFRAFFTVLFVLTFWAYVLPVSYFFSLLKSECRGFDSVLTILTIYCWKYQEHLWKLKIFWNLSFEYSSPFKTFLRILRFLDPLIWLERQQNNNKNMVIIEVSVGLRLWPIILFKTDVQVLSELGRIRRYQEA